MIDLSYTKSSSALVDIVTRERMQKGTLACTKKEQSANMHIHVPYFTFLVYVLISD